MKVEGKNMKIDEKKFNAAKLLLTSGGELKEVADYLKIGYSTIKIINHSENYEDYKHTIMAIGAKQTQKRREEKAKTKEQYVAPVVEIKQEIQPENRPESKPD